MFYEGVTLPIEYRGNYRRITTDGLYGIYDYYLEDLYVCSKKKSKFHSTSLKVELAPWIEKDN